MSRMGHASARAALIYQHATQERDVEIAKRLDAASEIHSGVTVRGTFPLSDSMIISMSRVTVRSKGQITIPDDVRRAAHLEEGDLLDAEITRDGILLRPRKLIDATQAWFWTPEWQAGERQAEEDLTAGRTTKFNSGDEMIEALQRRSKKIRRRPTS